MQNVRPGVVDRLGVGYERSRAKSENRLLLDLRLRFQRAVGEQARLRSDYPGDAGVMISQRTQGRPRAVKNIIADKVTAMTAAISILAALNEAHERQRPAYQARDDRRGRLLPDARYRLAPHLPAAQARRPAVNEHARPFQTADGFITIAPLTDKHWAAILKAVGHPEWFEGDEPRPERVRRRSRA